MRKVIVAICNQVTLLPRSGLLADIVPLVALDLFCEWLRRRSWFSSNGAAVLRAPFARRYAEMPSKELLQKNGAAVAAHVRDRFDRRVGDGEKFAGAFQAAVVNCLKGGFSRGEAEPHLRESPRAVHP